MDLSTTYLGLNLRNPLVVSACPLSTTIDGIRAIDDHGAGAVVLYSLFEEQIEHERNAFDHLTTYASDAHHEAGSYFPDVGSYVDEGQAYLDLISQARRATTLPIIASLNGTSAGGWLRFARQIEDAGAQALELNIYHLPTNLHVSGVEVEQRYLDTVAAVSSEVSIPVAVKIGPWFSSPGHMALQLVEAGASGLVLFNRFFQPDFDLEEMAVQPHLELSHPAELRQVLLWLSVLRQRIGDVDLAATSGIHQATDAIKALAAGADVCMVASTLLRHGIRHLTTLRRELTDWLHEHDYTSVDQLRGCLSREYSGNPEAFERLNYLRTLTSYANPGDPMSGMTMQG
ncbi:MAG: dihydroorotate dehydrogenase-like protein [Planctomycetota bacterium]|jgi:dihydroorotate dehydrogenase (fumarate)